MHRESHYVISYLKVSHLISFSTCKKGRNQGVSSGQLIQSYSLSLGSRMGTASQKLYSKKILKKIKERHERHLIPSLPVCSSQQWHHRQPSCPNKNLAFQLPSCAGSVWHILHYISSPNTISTGNPLLLTTHPRCDLHTFISLLHTNTVFAAARVILLKCGHHPPTENSSRFPFAKITKTKLFCVCFCNVDISLRMENKLNFFLKFYRRR